MRSRKLLPNLMLAAAVLGVAAVTYLFASARTSVVSDTSRASAVTPASTEAAATGADSPNEPADVLAAHAPPAGGDHRTEMRELVDALIRRGDPHSLGAAALLMNANGADFTDRAGERESFRGRVLALLERAANAAPTDAAVQSLALVFCRDSAALSTACDSQLYEDALAAIDPTNAWATTGELRRANAAHDSALQAAAIARMARGARIDTHRVEIETLLANAVQSVPAAPSDRTGLDSPAPLRRLITTTVNASPVDPLDAVAIACDRPSPGDAHENCIAVANLLRKSPDPILAEQGLMLARHLAPPGSAAAAELAKEQRRENWQTAAFLRMPRTPEQNARFLRDRIPSAELRHEVLLGNGVPLDPPADWPSP